MELLTGTMRNYPWGSRTLLADLRGAESPSPRPEAELWYGAHPGAPATVDGRPLGELIADDPTAALGERLIERFGAELPFLVKLLAAGEPLSLQAHPSLQQAQEGYAREDAAGIDVAASDRNYRDRNHKPEIIVALTPFRALSGFRPVAATREFFAALNCPALNHYAPILQGSDENDDLRALFTTWITIPAATRVALITEVVAAAEAALAGAEDLPEWIAQALRVVVELNDRYPGDVGVLGAMLLNVIELAPGEAAFTDAGQLHAYLEGLGVEVMANSDNVLRGGLTAKYVDVPELVRVLDFSATQDVRVGRRDDGTYEAPVDDFVLARHRLAAGESRRLRVDGALIAVCTAGEAVCEDAAGERLTIAPADAVWVPAADGDVVVTGGEQGAEVFVTTA
ncbi:mannose-6-phosphate isomerase, class I [Corynebacterium uterequi]|uniref:mannose-6-phosphate isomerase n=1 Tax=Corynebacterium uterequi TaxID=1072256 RepID=A0A0G3HCS7_9CORY|nr:mannose-6-phosphate isomerase, class I [Corynebacterium uterequi]AKK10520.1 mannose-6-phosphate isomerase, type 1 [Corynebacterium uterequi]